MSRRSLALASLAAVVLTALHWVFRSHEAGQWDVVNYCLGVEWFDPLQHRPHPPGYLLYVLTGKALGPLFGDAHTALVALSCICAGLSVVTIFLLAKRFVSPRLAAWVALLSCTNPLAWYYGSVGLSGITGLCLTPLAMGLLVDALRHERQRTLHLASLFAGLIGGFRQDLTLFLILPWLWVGLQSCWSPRQQIDAVLLFLTGVAIWLAPTLAVCGGVGSFLEASSYLGEMAREDSMWLGGSFERSAATWHRISVALALGLGVAGTVGLCLLPWRWRAVRGLVRGRSEVWLLVLWLAPPLLFWALVLFHKQAYLLPVLPGLLLVGVISLCRGGEAGRGARSVLLVSLLLGNALYFALPPVDSLYRQDDGFHQPHESLPLASRAARQWLESSLASLRAEDDRVRSTNAAIEDLLRATPSLAIVVLPNSPYDLRVAMWSFPDLPVYELEGRPGSWKRISRGRGQVWRALPPDQPLFIGGVDRVVWVASHDWDIAATLLARGGELLGPAPGVKFVVTDAGTFDL